MKNSDESSLYFDAADIIASALACIDSGNEFIFIGCGDSMYPLLTGGRDSVVLTSLPDRPLKCGDIVFYRRTNDKYGVHRIFSVDSGDTYTLLGDSQYRLEHGILRKDILAYVTAVIRNGKRIRCDKGLRRCLYTRFMHLRTKHPRSARRLIAFAWYSSRPFIEPKKVFKHLTKRHK